MSRKLKEVKLDLNTHVLEVRISAIEEKVLATIQNTSKAHSAISKAKLDFPSDGLHQNENGGISRKTRVDFPKLISTNGNLIYHPRESLVDSYQNDDGYDNL